MKKLHLIHIFLIFSLILTAFTSCNPQLVVDKKLEKQINDMEDVSNIKIGVQDGTLGEFYAARYEDCGAMLDHYNKSSDAISSLCQGKVDCVVMDEPHAKIFVDKHKELAILDKPIIEDEYSICVKKDNHDLKNEFDNALKQLKESGVIDQITRNYIGDDTKGTCPYISPKDVTTTKGTLSMATNAFFKPYEFYDNDKIVGIDPMIAQAVCDKLGYKLVVENMEFGNIFDAVKDGKVDFGMSTITATKERKETLGFTNPYANTKQVAVVKKVVQN